ncbi:hypothetical protein GCM10009727_63330 [Actinomadura napierensis]|uniref:Uncharacterized protein n=1 Tax=Actinomadura napierensis TaxID=267854 RepID=A0ABN3A759_9ACTN
MISSTPTAIPAAIAAPPPAAKPATSTAIPASTSTAAAPSIGHPPRSRAARSPIRGLGISTCAVASTTLASSSVITNIAK